MRRRARTYAKPLRKVDCTVPVQAETMAMPASSIGDSNGAGDSNGDEQCSLCARARECFVYAVSGLACFAISAVLTPTSRTSSSAEIGCGCLLS